MRGDDQVQGEISDLAHAIERQINERTSGRLQRVCVEITVGGLIVHGWTNSHYVKQLVLQAVSDIGQSIAVELDIRVGADGGTDAVGDASGNSRSNAVRADVVAFVDAGRSGDSRN